MAYYIGNLENCQAYDKIVSEKENYLKGDNWANPQEIEGSCWRVGYDGNQCNVHKMADKSKQGGHSRFKEKPN
jgi:hypothetical protein